MSIWYMYADIQISIYFSLNLYTIKFRSFMIIHVHVYVPTIMHAHPCLYGHTLVLIQVRRQRSEVNSHFLLCPSEESIYNIIFGICHVLFNTKQSYQTMKKSLV